MVSAVPIALILTIVFVTAVAPVCSRADFSENFAKIRPQLAHPGSVDVLERSYRFLYRKLDQYHTNLDVYSDFLSGGNHFVPSGWVGDFNTLDRNENWTIDCYMGISCIRIGYSGGLDTWTGVYWLSQEDNWGSVENGGIDLSGATTLSFWAKGEQGGEKVEFFAGGVVAEFGDSLSKVGRLITLSDQWQRYSINLSARNLSHVVNGFAWVATYANNNNGAIFYLDQIQYNKQNLNQPRFAVSFETLSNVEPDLFLRNAASIYDNSLILQALLARGTEEDLIRAQHLANAFVVASKQDRFYTDGRLRNFYSSGDLLNQQQVTRLPGWWDTQTQHWQEDQTYVGTQGGNLAWVILSLLQSYVTFNNPEYLATATRIAEWIELKLRDERGSGGYTGGFEGWEPAPIPLTWKSTEHNIAIYVAFMRLYYISMDAAWSERANHALAFIASMWNDQGDSHFFYSGTLEDGVQVNSFNYATDVQALAILAFNAYTSAINWVEANAQLRVDTIDGFDYNPDKDNIWLEGTAQMITVYQLVNNLERADYFLEQLRAVQSNATNADGEGLVATLEGGTSTGLDSYYYNRLHTGATAWHIFAETGYNPLWGTSTIQAENQHPQTYTSVRKSGLAPIFILFLLFFVIAKVLKSRQ